MGTRAGRKGGPWAIAAWVVIMVMFAISGLMNCVTDEEEEALDTGQGSGSGFVETPPYEPPADKPLAVGESFRVRKGVVELAGSVGQVSVSGKGDTDEAPALIVDAFPETPDAPAGGKQ
mgnify:CR=1 FL=1